jgi:hypothetical protein
MKDLGINALILGIICIPLGILAAALEGRSFFGFEWFIAIFGTIAIFVAILFGILGSILDESKGLAITGLILGIIGLIVRVVFGPLIRSIFFV